MTQEVDMAELPDDDRPLISPWKAVEGFRRMLVEGWGPGFKGMVVFGSLARGDWSPESDVDVMVLLDDSRDAKWESHRIWDLTYPLYDRYEVGIEPIVVTETEYQKGNTPLYFNVRREGWFVEPEPRRETVEKLMSQARQALDDARVLLDDERLDSATSRAYYAMFNAAQAALASLGISRSRHQGVTAAFGYHFSRSGQVPQELHQAFASGFEPRVSADYGPDTATEEVAREMVSSAQRFLEAVDRALASQG